MVSVFLGGTTNDSTWRDQLIPLLKIDYFDPRVENWSEKDQLEEIRQRQICDYCLYVITPKMTGVYSIAEVVDDSNKRPSKTIFAYLSKDDNLQFDEKQIKSLNAIGKMIIGNGGRVFSDLEDVARFLNSRGE